MEKEKIKNYQQRYLETNDETNRLLKLAIDLKESFALGRFYFSVFHLFFKYSKLFQIIKFKI